MTYYSSASRFLTDLDKISYSQLPRKFADYLLVSLKEQWRDILPRDINEFLTYFPLLPNFG